MWVSYARVLMRGFAAACSPLCGDASAVWKALLPTGYTATHGVMERQGFAPADPQALRYGSAASQRKGYLRLEAKLSIQRRNAYAPSGRCYSGPLYGR